MNTPKLSWAYSLSEDATSRLPALVRGVDFACIIEQIANKMSVLCCHRSEIKGTDFMRPVYTVLVGHELFDLFFNSQNGYCVFRSS
jgi:hypothetical protein